LWAESYDRDLRDVLSLQSELARAITYEVKVKLTPLENERLATARPVNPEAYQLYLKGRYFWRKRSKDGLIKAPEYFNQAVAIDPNYALAYAGIAECYPPLAYFGYVPGNEAFPKAREVAMRALAIDDTLAEAHSALAAEKQYYEWDWAGAEREFKRAIALNPNDATAHSWYALYLISAGRVQEGLAESKQALLFDPFSLTINNGHGRRLYWAREYDQAIEQSQKTRELEPNYNAESWTLALAMEQKGELKKAIAELKSNGSENTFALASLGHAYALSGNTAAATAIVRELEERSRGTYVDPLSVAWVYAGLAKKDEAFASLQKAAEQHSPLLAFLKVEPIFDPLRSDPRFAALLHQMDL
jgi:tetratricopeptide (TPR) repeat protein